jgi:hypothetical protein
MSPALDAKTRKRLEASERARLRLQEWREERSREEAEVKAGVEDAKVRGEATGREAEVERGRVRWITGIDWLVRKRILTPAFEALARDYGEAYRLTMEYSGLKSSLNEPTGGTKPGVDPGAVARAAKLRAHASARLHAYRASVHHEPGMVQALDVICGEEKTPREASRNGREADRLQALLLAALHIITGAAMARAA